MPFGSPGHRADALVGDRCTNAVHAFELEYVGHSSVGTDVYVHGLVERAANVADDLRLTVLERDGDCPDRIVLALFRHSSSKTDADYSIVPQI